MRNHIRTALFLPFATFALNSLADAATIPSCTLASDRTYTFGLPKGPGPATLAAVHCLPFRSSPFGNSPPELSPDGKTYLSYYDLKGLAMGRMSDTEASRFFEGRLSFSFSWAPFAWSDDARGVFGVTRDTEHPSGFAKGGFKPLLFSLDGTVVELPVPRHDAGPLDEVYWVANSGKAVVAFGTKGGYYRPEHDDPNPTIAFVDGKSGEIIQSAGIASFLGPSPPKSIGAVASRIDSEGRIQALMTFLFEEKSRWVYWVQGQAPRVVPLGVSPFHTRFALSPDAHNVLVIRNLSAIGPICEFSAKCPPPTPQTGPIAELRDIATGRVIWSITGTAKDFARNHWPAISPDGRYAAISLPNRDKPTIALISMTDGEVLQEFADDWWGSEKRLQFSPDGRSLWISGGSLVAVYAIDGM